MESVNADAEAFGDHWESSDCSMHSEAEALEHMKKRDRGHQSVSLGFVSVYVCLIRVCVCVCVMTVSVCLRLGFVCLS